MFNKTVFLSERIAIKNSEIMNAYFSLNKELDNLMDYVDIELVMPNFSNHLHLIAHKAPIDADRFRDYNALYSFRTHYDTIQGEFKDFSDIREGIEYILSFLLDMDNMFAEAKAIAEQEENYDYSRFINGEIIKIREYKKQFILLYDKLEQYAKEGNSLQDFDARCDSFFIMEV